MFVACSPHAVSAATLLSPLLCCCWLSTQQETAAVFLRSVQLAVCPCRYAPTVLLCCYRSSLLHQVTLTSLLRWLQPEVSLCLLDEVDGVCTLHTALALKAADNGGPEAVEQCFLDDTCTDLENLAEIIELILVGPPWWLALPGLGSSCGLREALVLGTALGARSSGATYGFVLLGVPPRAAAGLEFIWTVAAARKLGCHLACAV